MNTGRTGAFSIDIVSMIGRGWVHVVWSFPNAQPQRSLIHTLVSCVLAATSPLSSPAGGSKNSHMPRTSSAGAIGSVRTALMHAWHEGPSIRH